MKSKAVPSFWKLYNALPPDIQKLAKKQYQIWREDPFYPSLHFKRVSKKEQIYSLRISLNFRALSLKKDDTFYWFWIGSHDEYDKIIA